MTYFDDEDTPRDWFGLMGRITVRNDGNVENYHVVFVAPLPLPSTRNLFLGDRDFDRLLKGRLKNVNVEDISRFKVLHCDTTWFGAAAYAYKLQCYINERFPSLKPWTGPE